MLNVLILGTGEGSTLIKLNNETVIEKYFGFYLYLCFLNIKVLISVYVELPFKNHTEYHCAL